MDGSVFVSFHSTERPQYDELVSPTLSACAEVGLVTESAAPPDTDTVTLSDRNRTAVYDGNRAVQLNFRIDGWDGPIDSVLNITTTANTLVSVDADPDDEYTGFARDLVALIRSLGVELDPIYVSTFNTHVEPTTPSPETVLPFEFPLDIERIPWLGVYSEPVIEQLGGREYVLETPAWKVEELENGNILIITTRTPWEGYHSKLPADEHLLGEADAERATADDESDGLSDPFATLDRGEIGADVCVYRDDISEQFRNEDLHLVRVRVDERGDLRRLEDGSFVRNVVEDDSGGKADVIGRMLDDSPDDTTRDEQMVSALLHESIPPSFVRLEEPDSQNVVTKVMDLDVKTDKHDLLVSLGRVAHLETFDEDEDLEMMCNALDKIADLEDIDGIERTLEEWLG
ncbi:hypothetical protein C488_04467 [Natrinema pellirubrum DSM 15624]|uniref:Uncharacterized protein n=2 Tax=Natrinema pellirubrum TaxID=69525 RepID=L0JHT2_NATP1|nr:hypothetical protein Natpe_0468 [Natrinema pellirubrum DSM 15624]ELY79377.1 hypothetical protein C488_04467 [Natrinema pellirubrum DSM 15624]